MSTQTTHIPAFTLESGATLTGVPVSYRTWGQLNEARDNVVVVCHALTGSPDVMAWWSRLLGPGRALDTDRYFVICANVIGSPYGSLSPLSTDPETGRPYGPRFPPTTVRDCVRLHRALLDRLGIEGVAFAVGGSLGGMQALEWAFQGDYVRGIVPIAVGGVHSAWCIGWSEAQRQAIYGDPCWQQGHYPPDRPPRHGLAVARMIAMMSYRSFTEFGERFGRGVAAETDSFLVETYLRHQGARLVERFDPACYVHLTQVMDTHDVARGRGEYAAVLGAITQSALIIGVTTDVLYPVAEQRELAELLPAAELRILDAPQGHDAFLIEQELVAKVLSAWRRQHIDPHVEPARPTT